MKYKMGDRYRVTFNRKRGRAKQLPLSVEGKVMQDDKDFFTIEDKRGVRESFLKIDIQIGEYKIIAL